MCYSDPEDDDIGFIFGLALIAGVLLITFTLIGYAIGVCVFGR